MGNKWSKITKKLWLANCSAGLAIASLFSIGFSAWAEVGSAVSTTIDGINISVSNRGANVIAFDSESFYLYNTGIMQNQNDLVYTSSPYLSFLAVFEIKQADAKRQINCTFDLICPTNFSAATTTDKDYSPYKYKTLFYANTTNSISTIEDWKEEEKKENGSLIPTSFSNPGGNTLMFQNDTDINTNAYLHVYLEWSIVPPSDYKAFYTAVSELASLDFALNIQTEVI